MTSIMSLQPTIIKSFLQIFEQDKLAHAYLFEGSKGSGTFEVAIWVAQRFFCKTPNQNGPCGTCVECRRIQKGHHPDVHFVEPDGQTIKIDQIRQLKNEFHYKGVEGDKQCYIIDQVEKMTVQAANSLLKFLEEPDGHTLAILLTEDHTRLLPTIISRVQRFRFSRLMNGVLETRLKDLGKDSKYLSIFCSITDDFNQLSQWVEDGYGDQSIELVVNTLEHIWKGEVFEAILILQTDWLTQFTEKSQQLFALQLVKSYFKATLLKKKGQSSVWERYFVIPSLEWLQIVNCLETTDAAIREFASNKHFALIIEKLVASITEFGKMNV